MTNEEIIKEIEGPTSPENDEYIRGLNDAWDLVRKIIAPVSRGGYSCHEINAMFDTESTDDIIMTFDALGAMAIAKNYDTNKLMVGDVVKVISNDGESGYGKGLYIGEDHNSYEVMIYDNRNIMGVRRFSKGAYTISRVKGYSHIQNLLCDVNE